jgi:CRISPR-associated protein Cmr5
MNRQVEAYIPKALEAIKSLNIANEKGEVAKQFNGYIASFGASIRQAGLLPTVLFYSNANSNAEKEREKVVQAIEQIIAPAQLTQENRTKVEHAAIALKLAIRTYKLV